MSIVNHYFVDADKNRIDFLDVRWYQHPSGDWFPSVSTILDAYPKSAMFFEWLKKFGDTSDEIRDLAADKGSTVHKLTELYDHEEEVSLRDIEGNIQFHQIEWAMFERYVQFCERFKPEILGIELDMVSPELGFGGTLDRIMVLDGKTLIVDIKTGNSLHNHFWLQMAAYAKLYHQFYPDVKIDGMAILWLNAKTRTEGKKGDYQGKGYQLIFPPKKFAHYWKLFEGTHANWLEENEDAKPRNVSYQLTHKK